ncbi:MAG: hypothetical protein AB1938_28735 [Myxococcota bacterium]
MRPDEAAPCLPVLAPAPLVPWGLEEAAAPSSALVIYDFQLGDVPGDANDVHGVSAFFRDGSLTPQCDGRCDPE